MKKLQISLVALPLAVLLTMTGCADRRSSEEGAAQEHMSPSGSGRVADAIPDQSILPGEADGTWIDSLVQETIAEFIEPDMSEFEKVKAAFDYMIENVTLVDPVGLDLWRIRGDYTEPPSYVENRSLSVLLFRVGKCEDYAAVLTLLLQGMGLEAQYVPGLTYSTQGALVDHAWTVVQVDGVWYHVDCQLEQNISRHGTVRYKYFMRGDATLAGSHRWGRNLISSGLLSAEQNEEIAGSYTPPACPQDYPTPERKTITLAQSPDLAAIQSAIAEEFSEYEQIYGPLKPIEPNTIPPVFALEGYGPQD